MWCWHTDRPIDQWNWIGDPNVSPQAYRCNNLTKKPKMHTGEKTASWTNEMEQTKDCKCIHIYYSIKKLNSKWIKDFNMMPDTLSMIE